MDKDTIVKALKELKESSKKRNFTQTVDLVVNLKNLNLKKPEEQVEMFITLHNSKGKEPKICAFVGSELKEESDKVMDKTVYIEEFDNYAKDKKQIKKLAEEYDYFVAQANLMGKIAATFGRVFGPRGKMPNPKAGCVVPPKANLEPIKEKLKKTVKASAKKMPVIQIPLGQENQPEEEIIDNIQTFYKALLHGLPKEEHNIKSVYLKLTMGKPIKLK